jgi:hypothetical protein
MKLFGSQSPGFDMTIGEANPQTINSRLDSALTAVFNEDGKRTVLYYMTNEYGLTLEQASLDPSKFEKAMTSLLGEIGWMVVKRAILEEFWERKIPVNEVRVVEKASLREAFGFVRSLGRLAFFSSDLHP